LRASLSARGRSNKELRLFNCILVNCPSRYLDNAQLDFSLHFRRSVLIHVWLWPQFGAVLRLLVLLSLRHAKQRLPAFMAKLAHGFHVFIENVRCIGEGFHCAVNARLPQ
jgi:Ni/Fe-hydrogenase subunit HybB-like protein